MQLQHLLSYVRRAVQDYQMIEEGDTIAVGISGGKDSLILALALSHLKRFYPVKFNVIGITVSLGFDDFDLTAALEKAIIAGAGKLLEKVELFDVYKGSSIAEGKKSVAYTMTLRAADRTLTVEECDRAVNKVLKELANIGAELRS